MIATLEVVVRSTWIDSIGHVNQARYHEFLEWGRVEWFHAAGLDVTDLAAKGIGGAVVRVEADYRAECRLGETLRIETRLTEMGRASARYAQRIVKADGRTACAALVTGVFFDLRARKALPMPDWLRDTLAPLVEADWPTTST